MAHYEAREGKFSSQAAGAPANLISKEKNPDFASCAPFDVAQDMLCGRKIFNGSE
jgi:hypothetical protein